MSPDVVYLQLSVDEHKQKAEKTHTHTNYKRTDTLADGAYSQPEGEMNVIVAVSFPPSP